MLPTVEQVHVARKLFASWRVDACANQHRPAICGDDLRVLAAAAVVRARSLHVQPVRTRKAVVDAGQVRDGP